MFYSTGLSVDAFQRVLDNVSIKEKKKKTFFKNEKEKKDESREKLINVWNNSKSTIFETDFYSKKVKFSEKFFFVLVMRVPGRGPEHRESE
jgi:hypothetical protein